MPHQDAAERSTSSERVWLNRHRQQPHAAPGCRRTQHLTATKQGNAGTRPTPEDTRLQGTQPTDHASVTAERLACSNSKPHAKSVRDRRSGERASLVLPTPRRPSSAAARTRCTEPPSLARQTHSPPSHQATKPPDHTTTRPHDHTTTRPQDHRTTVADRERRPTSREGCPQRPARPTSGSQLTDRLASCTTNPLHRTTNPLHRTTNPLHRPVTRRTTRRTRRRRVVTVPRDSIRPIDWQLEAWRPRRSRVRDRGALRG